MAQLTIPLTRDGPGLLLRDILRGDDPQILALAALLQDVDPDILLLAGVDFDYENRAAIALKEVLGFPYHFAPEPNTGMATGLDMDGNGRLGEPRDSQGYGEFSGQAGLLLLSRYPIAADDVRDFSALLWKDLPGARLPELDGAPFPSEAALAAQRLSTTGHWDVGVDVGGTPLRVMAWYATPPVFDGPEDRNGLRNADEARFWELYLEGQIGAPPGGAFVLMGAANLDPEDGDGRSEAMRSLLAHPALQDVRPRSAGGLAADAGEHTGDPALDTVDWDEPSPGNLRVDYVLPSAGLDVVDAGVFWPAPDNPQAALLGEDGMTVSRHRLVWVDIEMGDS